MYYDNNIYQKYFFKFIYDVLIWVNGQLVMFDARFHDSSSHINLTTNYVQQFMTKRWNQR